MQQQKITHLWEAPSSRTCYRGGVVQRTELASYAPYEKGGVLATIGITGRWFSSSGSAERTVDVNLPPTQVYAQTWLYGTTGSGTQYTGIKAFRRRRPDGSDEVVDFGSWPNWPPSVFDFVSSITFGIATGTNQTAWAMLRIDHWG